MSGFASRTPRSSGIASSRLLQRLQDDRQVLLRPQVVRVRAQLRAQRVLRFGQPALPQVDDAQGRVRLRHVGLEPERPLERLHGGIEVPLLGVGLAQQHAQLGGVAVGGEQAGEDALRLRGAAALHQREAVRELQGRVRVPPRVVASSSAAFAYSWRLSQAMASMRLRPGFAGRPRARAPAAPSPSRTAAR